MSQENYNVNKMHQMVLDTMDKYTFLKEYLFFVVNFRSGSAF